MKSGIGYGKSWGQVIGGEKEVGCPQKIASYQGKKSTGYYGLINRCNLVG